MWYTYADCNGGFTVFVRGYPGRINFPDRMLKNLDHCLIYIKDLLFPVVTEEQLLELRGYMQQYIDDDIDCRMEAHSFD